MQLDLKVWNSLPKDLKEARLVTQLLQTIAEEDVFIWHRDRSDAWIPPPSPFNCALEILLLISILTNNIHTLEHDVMWFDCDQQ